MMCLSSLFNCHTGGTWNLASRLLPECYFIFSVFLQSYWSWLDIRWQKGLWYEREAELQLATWEKNKKNKTQCFLEYGETMAANRSIEKQLPRTWWPWASWFWHNEKDMLVAWCGCLNPRTCGRKAPFCILYHEKMDIFLRLCEKHFRQNQHYLVNYLDLMISEWLLTFFFLVSWRLVSLLSWHVQVSLPPWCLCSPRWLCSCTRLLSSVLPGTNLPCRWSALWPAWILSSERWMDSAVKGGFCEGWNGLACCRREKLAICGWVHRRRTLTVG